MPLVISCSAKVYLTIRKEDLTKEQASEHNLQELKIATGHKDNAFVPEFVEVWGKVVGQYQEGVNLCVGLCVFGKMLESLQTETGKDVTPYIFCDVVGGKK